MTECRRCDGKASLFLCPLCITKLTELLSDLPWFLDRLTEAAVGQTRMSDNAGRRSSRDILHGDATVEDCAKLTLARALAAGRCDARASDLLAEVADTLGYWVRVLCEARGLPTPTLIGGSALGRPIVVWLRHNISAIASSEDAADIMGDIERHRESIERVVNRPIRREFVGPCPTWRGESDGKPCGHRLRALPDAIEITCPSCKVTHNVNRLRLSVQCEAERQPMTFDLLCKVNKSQPEDYRVPLRTLQLWRQTERLKPRGYMRPDGHRGISRHTEADEPLYSWADVKDLRTARKHKGVTGAGAHKRERTA